MTPRRLLTAIFAVSGASGLIYEVAWMRTLRLLVGSTTLSHTIVLAAFMAGLALGAFVAGRRVDAAGRYDIYGNVVASFRIPWVSAVYLIAMVFLGLHMWHGIWSFGRSLGVAPATPTPTRRPIAAAVAIIIWLGFSIVPIAVLLGVIR